jgi:hypothetical protein
MRRRQEDVLLDDQSSRAEEVLLALLASFGHECADIWMTVTVELPIDDGPAGAAIRTVSNPAINHPVIRFMGPLESRLPPI